MPETPQAVAAPTPSVLDSDEESELLVDPVAADDEAGWVGGGRAPRDRRTAAPVALVALSFFALAVSVGSLVVMTRLHQQTAKKVFQSVEAIRGEVARAEAPPVERQVPGAVEARATVPVEDYGHLMTRALRRVRDRQYKEAVPDLEAAARVDSGPAAMYWLAKCYEETGARVRATRLLETVQRDFPNSAYAIRATCMLARQALKDGQHDAARKLFYRVLACEDLLGPEDRDVIADAAYGIGDAYAAAGALAAREEAAVAGAPNSEPEGDAGQKERSRP